MNGSSMPVLPQMSSPNGQKKEVVGFGKNVWLWDQSGWDLTRNSGDPAPANSPYVRLPCEITNVTIDPAKTALLIIDMQNYCMSKELGVETVPSVLEAESNLLNFAIPSARRSGIQIIWLNWGLTEMDLEDIPPSTLRVFGWDANCAEEEIARRCGSSVEDWIQCGEGPKFGGLGTDLGLVTLRDGTNVDAGRALMRDSWNAQLHGPLLSVFEQGQAALHPDILIHKNRNSGLWDSSTECTRALHDLGIRTLIFAGMNTDQCVMSTLQDAQARGFDTIMLKDACATGSPAFCQQNAEYNCCAALGFVSSCRAFATAT